MDIDLSSLLVFRTLAQTGSFTETGKIWNISQPAVSLTIGRLETAAGLVLLERSTTGTRLTSEGMQFLRQADVVCDSYLTFIDGMHSIGRRMDRDVKVAIDRSWFGSELRAALPKTSIPAGITASYCELRDNWGEALECSQFDVVVTGRFLRAGLSAGVQEAAIRRERGITIAWNPAFYPFDEVNFSFPEILRTSVLMPDSGVVTGFASTLSVWCEYAYGKQPANAMTFHDEIDAARAAASGMGVFVAPGDAMPRLGGCCPELVHVRTFEFLLPDAFTLGIYCRIDESSKDVLAVASTIGKLSAKLFGNGRLCS